MVEIVDLALIVIIYSSVIYTIKNPLIEKKSRLNSLCPKLYRGNSIEEKKTKNTIIIFKRRTGSRKSFFYQ